MAGDLTAVSGFIEGGQIYIDDVIGAVSSWTVSDFLGYELTRIIMQGGSC